MSKTFAPWKKDFWIAVLLWCTGLVWLIGATSWTIHTHSLTALILAFVSIFPVYFGFSFEERSHRRKHGFKVEKKALATLQAVKPAEWQVYSDWDMITSDANIDLVVRFPNTERCSVEIKSWHDWNRKGYVTRRKARNQVLWQCDEMTTEHAFIWLPEAKKKKTTCEYQRRKNKKRAITIVEGDVKCLIAAMHAIMRWTILVQFPHMPPSYVRNLLKKKHSLKWEKEYIRWAGYCTQNAIDEIKQAVEKYDGKLTVVQRF